MIKIPNNIPFDNKGWRKDTTINHFRSQEKRLLKAFSEYPKSMRLAGMEADVETANICRFIAKWRREKRIIEVGRFRCRFTKRLVKYFVTPTKRL